ncbi:MAG: sugar ABC transporter substrate-binding protein [Solirubrobacteraceae bacterium]
MAFSAVLVAVAVAGCGSSKSEEKSSSASSSGKGASTTSSSASSGAAKGAKKIAYISPVAAEPGQQQIAAGMAKGAKELGWSSSALDSALSSSKQVSNIETAINEGDNAIASWTLEPLAAAGAYEKAQSAGLPVIGVNSAGKGVTSTVWYQYNLCNKGGPEAQVAEFIAKRTPHAKTIMMTFDAAESIKKESECFAKEAKADGLDVINETNNEADTSSGSQAVFAPLLTKYPEVQAVWCYNDETALGVSAALIAANKTIAKSTSSGGVTVVGHNGDADAIEAVKAGRLTMTWDPNNLATGLAAVKLIKEAIEGGKSAKPAPITIASEMVDASTVGKYVNPLTRSYTVEKLPTAE